MTLSFGRFAVVSLAFVAVVHSSSFATAAVSGARWAKRANTATTGKAANSGITKTTQLDNGITLVEGQQQFQVQGRAPADSLLKFRIGVPSGVAVNGASGQQAASANGQALGLNVLLHGDGGQSFQDFPNVNTADNLMGVVVLAPNKQRFWGGGSGADRPDGPLHSQLLNELLSSNGQIAQTVNFDPKRVFFTGVSGGSLLLSGFMLPLFGNQFNTGALLICGGLPRNVAISGGAATLKGMRVHYQSSQDDLALLQQTIPESITQLETDAKAAGLSTAQINKQFTVNAQPNGGGHCGIDDKGFVTGVQFAVDNFGALLNLNNNALPAVLTPVGIVGHENPYNGNNDAAAAANN